MTDVTYTGALLMAISTAANKPRGYKYEKIDKEASCLYVHPDKDGKFTVPGCFIGTLLLENKIVTVEFFQGEDATNGCSTNAVDSNRLIVLILSEGEYRFTPKAQYFLRSVQTLQDQGNTWDDALRLAIQEWNDSNVMDRFE